ncbi:MAG: hypothetical protein ABSF18_03150 [Gammaproteobacteria bacterium]|jgi:hypothetical protein
MKHYLHIFCLILLMFFLSGCEHMTTEDLEQEREHGINPFVE